jgi:hypothetical protein
MPAAAFADVLDSHLRSSSSDARHSPSTIVVGTAASYGFFFVGAHRCTPFADLSQHPTAGLPRISGSRPRGMTEAGDRCESPLATGAEPLGERKAPRGPSTRPRRMLSVRQAQALRDLVALGARLADDFTRQELRSAFRLLARRYHPDRHAGSSDAERARLSTVFAGVCDAYNALATA